MAADEEINLRLTLDNGKVVSTQVSSVADDVRDMGESAERSGQDGAEAMNRMGDSAQEASQDAKDASDAFHGAAQSTSRFGGASNNASEFLFTLGDGAQDARYGIQGLGNNIGMAAEQASIMVRQAGSARGAMSALAGAIVGPAGAVLAIQSLIALGPEIIDFFEGGADAAERFNKQLEKQAEDMFTITEEAASFEAQTLDQARTVRDELSSSLEEQEQVVAALQGAGRDLSTLWDDATDAVLSFSNSAFGTDAVTNEEEALKGATAAAERLGLEAETVRDAIKGQQQALVEVESALRSQPDILPDANQRLQVLRQSKETVDQQIVSLKAATKVSEAYAGTSADRAQYEKETAQSLKDQVQQLKALKAASLELAGAVGEELRAARQEDQRAQKIIRSIRRREGREEGQQSAQTVSDDQIDELQPVRLPDMQTEVDDFKTRTVAQINSAIGVLQRNLDEVDGSNLRQEIRSSIGELESMKKKMMLAKGEAVDLGPALQQGLTNAISNVAAAIGKGDNIAKTLLQTLGSLAQRVGQLLIAFGVGGESLKAIASGNPALAIAAGWSLVALGAAAKSAVGDAVGGGGGEGPSRPEIEGGGEASAQLDVPGFKSGVDNFRGGLAEVHSNEILALPPASSVVNNQNAKAIRGAMSVLGQAGGPAGGARTMQGRMDGSLDINVSEPDYFGIRAELRRLDAKMEELA